MRRPSPTVPGTGLSPLAYVLLLVFSVGLFLFWDGPLWLAKREVSHVARFTVSYLAVVPAAVLLLLLARRFSWSNVIGTTGSAWGIKLLVTWALYSVLARGTALIPTPPLAALSSASSALVPEYHAARPDFARGVVRGSVVRGEVGVPFATVLIDAPLPGSPLAAPSGPLRLSIGDSRYDQTTYLAQADSAIEVVSRDPILHTLHLYEGSRAVSNAPVPAGGAARAVARPEPGIYEARCDAHATERATVVVVDHPYAMKTDENGQFAFSDVAVGPVTLVVVVGAEPGKAATVVRRVPARVESTQTTVVHIDLTTPEVAEERL